MEKLDIKQEKQVCCNGFVQYSQEIIELAKQGYVLDIRNRTAPSFMLGLFQCNMLLLDDKVEEDISTEKPKEKRSYSKSEKAKEALKAKLPAEAIATITQ